MFGFLVFVILVGVVTRDGLATRNGYYPVGSRVYFFDELSGRGLKKNKRLQKNITKASKKTSKGFTKNKQRLQKKQARY